MKIQLIVILAVVINMSALCQHGQGILTKITSRSEGNTHVRRGNKGNLIQINPIDTLCTIRNEQLETILRDHRSRYLTKIHLTRDLENSIFSLLNARSVATGTDKIKDLIFYHKLDILALTETWLNDSSTYVAPDVTPPGFILSFGDWTVQMVKMEVESVLCVEKNSILG